MSLIQGNVLEYHNEGLGMFLAKTADIFKVIGLDLRKMYTDNIHCLSSTAGKGVMPIMFVNIPNRD